tara:strand:- start:21 stop:221 length:201 start_codon:yes stop_codon:yes gene_type:complete
MHHYYYIVVSQWADIHPVERSFQGFLTVSAKMGWLLPFSFQFFTRLAGGSSYFSGFSNRKQIVENH